jgi:hypothetical protein
MEGVSGWDGIVPSPATDSQITDGLRDGAPTNYFEAP